MSAIVRQRVRKGRRKVDIFRFTGSQQSPPPSANVESSRDMYGFVVRPQHLARYKEYSRIYQEEETERAEKWDHFLKTYPEPDFVAEPEPTDGNVFETRSLPRELERDGGGHDKEGDNTPGNLDSPSTRSENDAVLDSASTNRRATSTQTVRSWSSCQRSLWAVEQALRAQGRKHGFSKVHEEEATDTAAEAAADNAAEVATDMAAEVAAEVGGEGHKRETITTAAGSTEAAGGKKRRHRKPTTSDVGLLTIMRRKSGTVLPLEDIVLVDDSKTPFRQEPRVVNHSRSVVNRSVQGLHAGPHFEMLRTSSLPPPSRLDANALGVATGGSKGIEQSLGYDEAAVKGGQEEEDAKSEPTATGNEEELKRQAVVRQKTIPSEEASAEVVDRPSVHVSALNDKTFVYEEADEKKDVCGDELEGMEVVEKFEDHKDDVGRVESGEDVFEDTIVSPDEEGDCVKEKTVKEGEEVEVEGNETEDFEDVPLGSFCEGWDNKGETSSLQVDEQILAVRLPVNGWDKQKSGNSEVEKDMEGQKGEEGGDGEKANGNANVGITPVDCPWVDELQSLVRGGVPMAMRGELWQLFSGAKEWKIPGHYNALLVLLADGGGDGDGTGGLNMESSTAANYQKTENGILEKWTSQIEKDLPRTFPGHPALDQNGRNALRRLLTAYARHNPSVGYCQGMNFLAALLLLLMSEEAAFWCLVAIIDDYFEGYYTEKMVEAQVDQLVLDQLVRKYFPRVVSHLDAQGVQVAWVSGPWFLSVFVNVLPWETVLRVWDALLYEGNRSMLFRTALALMEMQSQAILATRDVGDAVAVLQNMAGSTFDSSQLVLIASMGYSEVNEELLCGIREEFRPSVLESVQARTVELSRWGTPNRHDNSFDKQQKDRSDRSSSRRSDEELESEEERHGGGDSARSSPLIEDKMPVEEEGGSREPRITWSEDENFDITELINQVKWLKGELSRALEAEQLALMRTRELSALREHKRVLNEERNALKEQVEFMHEELKATKELLREKEDHTKALTEVMVRMDEEQRATEEHRLQSEVIAARLEKSLAEQQLKHAASKKALMEMEQRAVMAESMLEACTAAMANTTSSYYKEQVHRRQTRGSSSPSKTRTLDAADEHDRSDDGTKSDSLSGRVGWTGRVDQEEFLPKHKIQPIITQATEALHAHRVREGHLSGTAFAGEGDRTRDMPVTPKGLRMKWPWQGAPTR